MVEVNFGDYCELGDGRDLSYSCGKYRNRKDNGWDYEDDRDCDD